jgi:hypothetical protein
MRAVPHDKSDAEQSSERTPIPTLPPSPPSNVGYAVEAFAKMTRYSP